MVLPMWLAHLYAYNTECDHKLQCFGPKLEIYDDVPVEISLTEGLEDQPRPTLRRESGEVHMFMSEANE